MMCYACRYLTTSYGTGQDIDERIVEGEVASASLINFLLRFEFKLDFFSPLQRTLCSRPSGMPKLSGTTTAVASGSSWRSTSTRRCSGPFSLSRSRALTSADKSYELQMKPNGGTYSARSIYVDLSAFVKRRDLPSAVSDAYAA